MASIGDVAAALRAVLATVNEAADRVRAADVRTEDTLTAIHTTLSESSNPDAHAGLASLTAARERLAHALSALKAGADRMSDYIASIAGGGGASPPASPLSGSPPRFDLRRRNDVGSSAIRRFGWPRNSKGRISARGVLLNSDGDAVLHQPLRAKRNGEVFDAPELKEPWRSDRAMKTSWHIEGGAAAYMRRTATRVMSLWLNVPPCGGLDRPDPKGCFENLPKIIPKGYTLYVHAELENGGYQRVIVKGTGEALK